MGGGKRLEELQFLFKSSLIFQFLIVCHRFSVCWKELGFINFFLLSGFSQDTKDAVGVSKLGCVLQRDDRKNDHKIMRFVAIF